jgi:chromate reductase, NAD(P)H dehydrogenase (quinone)
LKGAALVKILAISGSLRTGSSNTAVLQAIAALAPTGVQVILYSGLSELPHFNPDLDAETPPPTVQDFRSRLLASDGVLISTPEYAHGVPGTLKNALDWLVRSGELYEKPVALINASPRSTLAQASLSETLTTMTARLIPAASATVALTNKNLDASAICKDPEISRALSLAITAFAGAIASVTTLETKEAAHQKAN